MNKIFYDLICTTIDDGVKEVQACKRPEAPVLPQSIGCGGLAEKCCGTDACDGKNVCKCKYLCNAVRTSIESALQTGKIRSMQLEFACHHRSRLNALSREMHAVTGPNAKALS